MDGLFGARTEKKVSINYVRHIQTSYGVSVCVFFRLHIGDFRIEIYFIEDVSKLQKNLPYREIIFF